MLSINQKTLKNNLVFRYKNSKMNLMNLINQKQLKFALTKSFSLINQLMKELFFVVIVVSSRWRTLHYRLLDLTPVPARVSFIRHLLGPTSL